MSIRFQWKCDRCSALIYTHTSAPVPPGWYEVSFGERDLHLCGDCASDLRAFLREGSEDQAR